MKEQFVNATMKQATNESFRVKYRLRVVAMEGKTVSKIHPAHYSKVRLF